MKSRPIFSVCSLSPILQSKRVKGKRWNKKSKSTVTQLDRQSTVFASTPNSRGGHRVQDLCPQTTQHSHSRGGSGKSPATFLAPPQRGCDMGRWTVWGRVEGEERGKAVYSTTPSGSASRLAHVHTS